MQTTVYTSDEEFQKSEGDRATTQGGSVKSEEEKIETNFSKVKAFGVHAGAQLSVPGGSGLGANAHYNDNNAVTQNQKTLNKNKSTNKLATIRNKLDKKQSKLSKTHIIMELDIIRYEMFLREVKANYIQADFLR